MFASRARMTPGMYEVLGYIVILDILAVRLLEENAYFVLAVAVEDRAFHGEDFFDIALVDFFSGMPDNHPEKNKDAGQDYSSGQDCYAVE